VYAGHGVQLPAGGEERADQLRPEPAQHAQVHLRLRLLRQSEALEDTPWRWAPPAEDSSNFDQVACVTKPVMLCVCVCVLLGLR